MPARFKLLQTTPFTYLLRGVVRGVGDAVVGNETRAEKRARLDREAEAERKAKYAREDREAKQLFVAILIIGGLILLSKMFAGSTSISSYY